jgi:hypothetical protein
MTRKIHPLPITGDRSEALFKNKTLVHNSAFLSCAHMDKREHALWGLFYKGTNPIP